MFIKVNTFRDNECSLKNNRRYILLYTTVCTYYYTSITHYAIIYTSLVHNMRKNDTLIEICDHRTTEHASLCHLSFYDD